MKQVVVLAAEKFRDMIRDELGIKPGDDPIESVATRVTISSLIFVWEPARQRIEARNREAVEARVEGRPRLMLVEVCFASCVRTSGGMGNSFTASLFQKTTCTVRWSSLRRTISRQKHCRRLSGP